MVLNCGKACGSREGVATAVGVTTAAAPAWSLLFCPEIDAFLDRRPPQQSGHLMYRHWPGEGSYAMMLVIRSRLRHLVQKVAWLNRCGAVHFFQKPGPTNSGINLYVVVIHCAHGDLLDDTFMDIVGLLCQRP